MAKIKCSECGTKYSGNFCPNCSAPAPAGQKKKKKIGCLPVLLIFVAIFIIAGMGGEDEPKQPTNTQGDSSIQATNNATESQDNAPQETESPAVEDITIDETEIYNANGIIITATKISEGWLGTDITINISNDSTQNIIVSSRDLSVNGYMMPLSGLYSDVAAGKKAVESLTLSYSELAQAGIETIADIEFSLNISNSETFVDIDNTSLIKLSTSAAPGFIQPIDDSGEVIYDANNIRIICKGLKNDTLWEGALVFYIENNSGSYVSVHSENVSVNGYMVDDAMWADLRSQTRCIDCMYLLTFESIGLEGIDDVENIEFSLTIVDEHWNLIAASDIISLNFD